MQFGYIVLINLYNGIFFCYGYDTYAVTSITICYFIIEELWFKVFPSKTDKVQNLVIITNMFHPVALGTRFKLTNELVN
jgi:hypothetical protein